MKKRWMPVVWLLTVSFVNAQAPAISWQKTFGGSSYEVALNMKQTNDGGFIVAGYTASADGQVTGFRGASDVWIVKLNNTGNLEWQKTFGGSDYEFANSIQQTSEGGYIVAGGTSSNDGDVSGNRGEEDFWILKLSSDGSVEWKKVFGGTGYEEVICIKQSADGGYLAVGGTNSADGDVTGSHGADDAWVIKLSSSGTLLWQKTLGGTGDDFAYNSFQMIDGSYMIACSTGSSNGDVSNYHGGLLDAWLVKLSGTGNLLWQKTYGSSGYDGAFSIVATTNGGFIFTGYADKNDGDVSAVCGKLDVWVVKLNSVGDIEWQRTFGGTDNDFSVSIKSTTDGGYVIAGSTYSTDFDITGLHGNADAWILKLSSAGVLQWQKVLGGAKYEEAVNVLQTNDAGYIVAGATESIDGDVTDNRGMSDYWIVKLANSANTSVISLEPGEFIRIGPNPVKAQLNVQYQLNNNGNIIAGRLLNETGQTVLQLGQIFSGSVMQLQKLSDGVYFLQLQLSKTNKWYVYRIVKQAD